MKKERKNYSIEFKIRAVELSKQRGSVKSIAQELNIPLDNLKRWSAEYTAGKYSESFSPAVKSKDELEIIQLKRALYESNLERDILKKAVSIFSKSDR